MSTGALLRGSQCATPTFSPSGGTYGSPQAVTISTTTSGASIRYTTDGSTPTDTTGNVYGGSPVSVYSGCTFKAIAYEGGFTDSLVTSSVYTINSPTATLNVLYSFSTSNGGGITPLAGLVLGSDGNYYGTTSNGGSGNDGTVFGISAYGALTTSVSFTGTNGATPYADLVLGGDGNYYGTTRRGGSANDGTVFKLSVSSGGVGTLTSLVSFTGTNGAYPDATLVQGSDGNFYGTTQYGGASGATGHGTVFKITLAGVLTTLVSFVDTNGAYPTAGLVQGSDGNFYGTTSGGGSNSDGTVFKITPAGALTTLVSFTGLNGGSPTGGLVQGVDGNFYGTTESASYTIYGTVFRITPAGALTTLVSFNGANGYLPDASLLQGGDGNFYGTTSQGGSGSNGTVFQVTPSGVMTTLALFNGANGAHPDGRLMQTIDPHYFYGTTSAGGTSNGGEVFEVILSPTAAPVFSPPAGIYTSPPSVTITSATNGATIRYTTDGSTPTETNGAIYSGAVNIGSSTYFRAVAYAGGYSDSAITAANYSVGPRVAAPVFSPAPGTYTSAPAVTISTTTSGATIRYTTDGSTPTETHGTIYSVPVNISATTTLQAIGYGGGRNYDSTVTGGTYTIAPSAATPTFSPVAGTYTGAQSVAITSATSGASIAYTTDGSTPTESGGSVTNGTLLSNGGSVSIGANTTLNAIAFASGYTDSAVATAAYIINLPQAATPTFSPPGGTYAGTQSVAITSTTSGASIAYTTDGSTPTESGGSVTNGTLLSNGGSVSVGANTAFNAMAFASGYTDSAVATAAYTISEPIPTTLRTRGSTGNRQPTSPK
ncbi:MAG TPA: choice-of-anchor tandem repeat GloVer-containing protein [Opitutaceae bacterium]|nr:choice-of-anchor tandem repeat GloVer-containing protein [Opitutaceae bacterium]